jgi:hypothetical protein
VRGHSDSHVTSSPDHKRWRMGCRAGVQENGGDSERRVQSATRIMHRLYTTVDIERILAC